MARSKGAQFFRDSVFRFSIEPQPNQEDVGPGIPILKASFSFTEDELDWLDANCWAMRRKGWSSVTRSTLVRALIRTVGQTPISLDEVTNEDELVDALRLAIIESVSDVPEDSTNASIPDSSVLDSLINSVPAHLEAVSARVRALPIGSNRRRKSLKTNRTPAEVCEVCNGELHLD